MVSSASTNSVTLATLFDVLVLLRRLAILFDVTTRWGLISHYSQQQAGAKHS